MRTVEEIEAQINEYEKLKNTEFSPLNAPLCNRCINLLKWVIAGEDIKQQKRNQRIHDRAWFVKKLGRKYMDDKAVHHGKGGYCFILGIEAHKRLHGKIVLEEVDC